MLKVKTNYKFASLVLLLAGLLLFPSLVYAQNTDSLRQDIYSMLKCCSCKDSFAKCTCAEAKEMKAYIEAFLESKLAKGEILFRVAKKYTIDVIMDQQAKQSIKQRLINEAGQTRPQIVLETAFFNFGSVSRKQGKISKSFKIYNKGNSDLVVTNVRVSCPCVSASLKVGKDQSPYFGVMGANSGWKETISPGSFGELEVVLDLNHSSMGIGKQIRDVFIASNDPVYPQIALKAEVELDK